MVEDYEFVNINEFHYKGKNVENVGDGDSFCYLPCNIYGVPKLYYGDCHFSCALDSLEDIVHSFYGGKIENLLSEDDINEISEELWLNCISEPSRIFYDKYIVVGLDGHVPTCDYVSSMLEYIGGKPSNYCIVYNDGTSVKEIPCDYFLAEGANIGLASSKNNKPSTMRVPKKLKSLYDTIAMKRNGANQKFPKNMTRAEYYYLTRQESKKCFDRIITESINNYVRKLKK